MLTLGMRRRDPFTRLDATSQKLAALRSPGISMSRGARRAAGRISTRRPSTLTSAPMAVSISSVWLRVATGSTTAVVPSANSPASSTADLTCALGTAGRYSMPCSGSRPPTMSGGHCASAPISRSGVTTRSIGRVDRDSSPLSSEAKGCAESSPASNRMVVPELPQSSALAAALRRRMPKPRTAASSMSTPRALMHDAVDFTSAPVDNPRK